MIAAGNNELVLCRLALCRIVERHLNENQPVKDGAIRVVTVEFDGKAGFVFRFTAEPPK